jgi:hypothetical protein
MYQHFQSEGAGLKATFQQFIKIQFFITKDSRQFVLLMAI